MSTPIDFSTLTLNKEEARSSSELIFKKAFSSPLLEQTHDVQTGIDTDRYIPIFGNLDLAAKLSAGDCSSNVDAQQIPVSQKLWEPKLHSFRIVHCEEQVPDLLKFWKKSMVAANTWEAVDSEMIAFIETKVLEQLDRNIITIADFADKTHSPVGDATGNQLLTVGKTKTLLNTINGMWSQIFTDGAGAKKMYRYVINENTLANKTAQDTLPADAALTMLRSMYNNIAPEAFDYPNLTFQITRSLFNNWQDFMEDKSLVFMLNRTEEGSTVFSYRGIPIVVRKDWDRVIRGWFDLGDTFYFPHRAILAPLSVIPVGTSDTESLSKFSSIYDPVTKKHYIDVAFKLDMKVLLEDVMAVAY